MPEQREQGPDDHERDDSDELEEAAATSDAIRVVSTPTITLVLITARQVGA